MKHDDAMDALLESLTSAPDAGHLDPATQLIPYVDGTLDAADREIAESHLDDCALCRAEAADLRAMLSRPKSKAAPNWISFAAAATVATAMFLAWPRTEPPPAPAPLPRAVLRPAPQPIAPAPARATQRYENAEWQRLVDDFERTGTLTFPAFLADLAPPPDSLRGDRETREDALSPAGRVIDDARPQFSWHARDGARYVVSVFDGETEVARSGELTAARWRPGSALRRARTYLWQVRVSRNGEEVTLPRLPAPPALFRITSDEEHRALREARTRFPDDQLLHAVLYAKSGMREEAERALHSTR